MEFKRFTPEELYISPFSRRRLYDPDGHVTYVNIERNLRPTGIDQLDFIARTLSSGANDYEWMAGQMDVRYEDLCAFVRVMTTCSAHELRRSIMFLLADDLLRYTNLNVDEIARRCGASSAPNLSQMYRDNRHTTPFSRRKRLRQEGDLGRFVL